MAKCRACGEEIHWIITKNGKKMPIDAKPRNFYIFNRSGLPVLMQGHEPHFATCPKAKQFKKK